MSRQTCPLKWLAYSTWAYAVKLLPLSFEDQFQKILALTRFIKYTLALKNYFTGMAFNITRGSKLPATG